MKHIRLKSKAEPSLTHYKSIYLHLGAAAGTAVGLVFGSVVIGTALGAGIGFAVGAELDAQAKQHQSPSKE